MDYERLLADVGRITPYQKFLFTLVCLVGIPSAFHHLSIVFTAGIPEFTCDPRSLFAKSSNFQNFTFHDNDTITFNSSTFDVGQCSVTQHNESLWARNATDSSELKCSTWFYDRSIYASTAVSKWNLVCDYKWLAAMPASVSMAGIMVGSLLFGIISDRYGRRPVFLISTLMQAVSGLACAFSPHFYVFVATKFLIGFFTSGQFLSAFVISMEIVERKHRTWLGFVIMISWAVGYMLLAGIAYAAREWWILQVIINVPSILMLLYYFVLPESPRWLLVHGRVDEAMKVIQKLVAGSDVNLKAGHDLLVQIDNFLYHDSMPICVDDWKNIVWNTVIKSGSEIEILLQTS